MDDRTSTAKDNNSVSSERAIPSKREMERQFDFESILKLLSSRNDTEKFAGLLLCTKFQLFQLQDSQITSLDTLEHIFKAVGFSFVERLLKTEDIIQQNFGWNLVSSFCLSPKLVDHPDILTLIPLILKRISIRVDSVSEEEKEKEEENPSDIRDLLSCLVGISGNSQGANCICLHGGLEILSRVYLRSKILSEDRDMITHLLSLLASCSPDFSFVESALILLSTHFCRTIDKISLLLPAILNAVLSSCRNLSGNVKSEWVNNIKCGATHMLCSRLDKSTCQDLISLVSTMVFHFGFSWCVKKPKYCFICTREIDSSSFSQLDLVHSKFSSIIVPMIKLEISCSLDQGYLMGKSNKEFLSVCLSLLEAVIHYLTAEEYGLDASSSISADDFIPIYESLRSIAFEIIHFLHESEEKNVPFEPFLHVLLRFLGIWISEESEALRSELYSVLPYILKLCSESSSIGFYTLTYYLSGFINVTNEKEGRLIFLESNGLPILLHFLEKKCTSKKKPILSKDWLFDCTQILINILYCDEVSASLFSHNLCGTISTLFNEIGSLNRKIIAEEHFRLIHYVTFLVLILAKFSDSVFLVTFFGEAIESRAKFENGLLGLCTIYMEFFFIQGDEFSSSTFLQFINIFPIISRGFMDSLREYAIIRNILCKAEFVQKIKATIKYVEQRPLIVAKEDVEKEEEAGNDKILQIYHQELINVLNAISSVMS